jgi:hypothetical protein
VKLAAEPTAVAPQQLQPLTHFLLQKKTSHPLVTSAANHFMKQCVTENLKTERMNVPSISFSYNLATNSHYRADISCQGKFLPDVVTPERTFDYNRIKPAKLPVCLLGSNAVILPALFLLQCTGQRTSIFGVFEVIFN